MKIILVGYKLFPGRPEAVNNIVYGLAKSLVSSGHDVYVLTNGESDNEKKVGGVNVIEVGKERGLVGLAASPFKFRKELQKLNNEEKPKVIHDFFVIAGASYLITHIAIGKSKHKPLVVKSVWNFPLKLGNVNELLQPFNYKYFLQELIFRFILGNVWISKYIYSKFDVVLSHNRFEKEKLEKLLGKTPVRYLPVGFEKKKNISGDHLVFPKKKENESRVLYFGHPSVKKGVYEFIKAVPLVLEKDNKVKFYFCFSKVAESKDDLTEAVSQLSRRYPANVFYKIGYFDIKILFENFDLLVLPLRHNWASISPPLTILEAKAHGIPVLTNRLDITKEVKEEKDGVFFLNDLSADSLSEGILNSINRAKGLVVKYPKNRSWEILVKKYLDIYNKELGKSFYKDQKVVSNYEETRFAGKGGQYISSVELTSLIGELTIEDKNIVDVGTGTGRVTKAIIKKKPRSIFAVDSSKDMLNTLSSLGKKVRPILATTEKLPIKNDTVDIVFALRLYEHLNTGAKETMLKESSRILKKGGKLVFSTLNKNSIERLLLPFRKSQSPMFPDDTNFITLAKKYGFRIEREKYNFIFPRAVFRDTTKILLPLFIRTEKLLIKTPLRYFGAHFTLELRLVKKKL